MFLCCRSSSQEQQNSRNTSRQQQQHLHPNRKKHNGNSSISRNTNNKSHSFVDVERDIQAVKSWREQRRTTTNDTTPDGTDVSTAVVLYNSNNNNNGINKLATIEEQSHEQSYSINTSLSSSLTHLPDNIDQQSLIMNEEIDPVPVHSSNDVPTTTNVNVDRMIPTTIDDRIAKVPTTRYKIPKSNPTYSGHIDGSFPTLEEDEWRKEQRLILLLKEQEQQDEYLSSSSDSTIEDLIIIATLPNNRNIHDDDDYDENDVNSIRKQQLDDDNKNIIVTSSKRPEPDVDDSDRPVVDKKSSIRGSILSSEQQQQLDHHGTATPHSAQSLTTSSLLRDKEPELYAVNNSIESEELDAIIAAIDNNAVSQQVDSTASISSNKNNQTVSTASVLPGTISQLRDSRLVPIEHSMANDASIRSRSILVSGSSTNPSSSANSIKLIPSRRDSPSILDPKSYMTDHDHTFMVDHQVHSSRLILVSPSSDGSSTTSRTLPSPNTGVGIEAVTSSRIGRGRHRSTPSPQSSLLSSNNIIDANHPVTSTMTIPETAHERRKVRSQSRGRRIRERARTLLSTYKCQPMNHDEFVPIPSEDNYSTNSTNNNEFENHNKNNIRAVMSTDSSDVSGNKISGISNVVANDQDHSKVGEPPQTVTPSPTTAATTPENMHSDISTGEMGKDSTELPKSWYSSSSQFMGGGNSDNTTNKNTTIIDHLSDIPNEIDPVVLEKYLKACRILKSSLIDKNNSIPPSDKEFLAQILDTSSITKEDPRDDTTELTAEKVKQYDSSNTFLSQDSLQLQRSTPLFDAATTVITTTDIYNASANNIIPNQHHLHTVLSGESSGVTEQELQLHNRVYMMNHDNCGRRDDDENSNSGTVTPSHTQVSSSVFSRVNDDYPYKLLSKSTDYRPTVLIPWMMNALRGFFPLDICEYHFWHKYSLHREENSCSSNIMDLLSTIKDCTYTILCVETVDGSVFGAFCTSPWQIQSSWYGSGDSSFLWRLKHPRLHNNIANDNLGYNEIEIYPYTRSDHFVQYCTTQTLAVGGGTDWTNTKEGYSPYTSETDTGIGLLIDGDLMGGETNSCVTFANPRLDHHKQQKATSDLAPLNASYNTNNDELNCNDDIKVLDTSIEGNEFHVQTFEVYTLTKYSTIQEAEQSEM